VGNAHATPIQEFVMPSIARRFEALDTVLDLHFLLAIGCLRGVQLHVLLEQ